MTRNPTLIHTPLAGSSAKGVPMKAIQSGMTTTINLARTRRRAKATAPTSTASQIQRQATLVRPTRLGPTRCSASAPIATAANKATALLI